MHHNRLSPAQYHQHGRRSSLEVLVLNNNGFQVALRPMSLHGSPRLQVLDLSSHNSFHGTLHPDLFLHTLLKVVLLSNNSFSGSLPPNLGEVRTLLADSNHFVGTLPSRAPQPDERRAHRQPPDRVSAHAARDAAAALLRGNEISGTVPSALVRQRSLRYLDLTANRLTGSLPVTWGRNLSRVEMGSNRLAGTVPVAASRGRATGTEDNDLSCALKGTPFRGGPLNVLTGNAFGCLWPDSAVVQADEWGEEHICEWWRMLNLSGSPAVMVSPLTLAVVSLVLFAGAYALVTRESSGRGPSHGVELLEVAGTVSTAPASDDEAHTYVAFQRASALVAWAWLLPLCVS